MFKGILKHSRVRTFTPIYLAGIFLSLHYATILYVNSTFLGRHFSSSEISGLFLLAAVFNIALFLAAPRLLNWIGLKSLYLLFILITGASLAGLAFSTTPLFVAGYFVAYAGMLFMIYYCLDIFLENVSVDEKTGGIRGLYLTLISAAIALGPLLLALFVEGSDLLPVYIAALLLLVPPYFIGLLFKFERKDDIRAAWLKHAGALPFRAWWKADSVRRATLARLVLETFYAIMIIYTPIYLNSVLGFQWAQIGVVFAIMLIPFILFEWPMGVLSDRMFGEKEIMSIGFFITGSSLLLMPFLGLNLWLWAAVLFLSRVGASFIEVSTESHFFKHVDARDSALISIFRLSRPAGLIVGAFIGAVTVAVLPYSSIFIIVAVVVFLGLKESLYLKDTL